MKDENGGRDREVGVGGKGLGWVFFTYVDEVFNPLYAVARRELT